MRKLITLFGASLMVFALVLTPSTLATGFDGTDLCRENGQRYDATTWVWDGSGWEVDYSRPGFRTSIEGDQYLLSWQSNKIVRSVLVQTAGGVANVDERVRSGGVQSEEPIEAIVLCLRGGRSSSSITSVFALPKGEKGDSGDDFFQGESFQPANGQEHDIPEFGGLAAIAVVGLAGAAVVALRRRH